MVYVRGRGIVVSEPTIVVIDSDNKHNVRAVGDEAEILLGRTGDKLVAVRPLKAGSIVNFDMAEILLRYLMGRPVLQRESALIWMEDVAGYLLALADIIQERQKERTVIHEATER